MSSSTTAGIGANVRRAVAQCAGRSGRMSATICGSRSLTNSRITDAAHARDRARDIALQTAQNIGNERAIRQYRRLFTSTDSTKFAVIKVGGAIISEHLEELCHSLRLLYELGLYPVIVHGAGPQLNSVLEESGVEPHFEDGIRVTDSKTLGIARKVFLEENLKLTSRLDELGVPTRSLSGVFISDYLDEKKWQFVGNITRVKADVIERTIKAGYVPILHSMAEAEDGQLLNVNADAAAVELARAIKPSKVVFLSEKGGLEDGKGELISTINMDTEFQHIMAQSWCQYGTRLKLKLIRELLGALPPTSSVVVTHPSSLQKELFTSSATGTSICRGDEIRVATSLDDIDSIEEFKTALLGNHSHVDCVTSIEHFLDSMHDKPFAAYYDNAMRCMAVVLPATATQPMATLATFNITKGGWSSKIPESILDNLRNDHPNLVWAVPEADERMSWFADKADGHFIHEGRVLFHYGCGLHNIALPKLSAQLSDAVFSNAVTVPKREQLQTTT